MENTEAQIIMPKHVSSAPCQAQAEEAMAAALKS